MQICRSTINKIFCGAARLANFQVSLKPVWPDSRIVVSRALLPVAMIHGQCPALANDSFETLKTQFFAVGAEFNAFKIMKFRVGAAKNIASGISDTAGDVEYTAGVGIWLGFNLDVAVLLNDHAGGVFVQTGFQF